MNRGTLCAAIGSELYRKEYIERIVRKWRDELLLLSKIAKIPPQVSYSAYIMVSKVNAFSLIELLQLCKII